MGDRSSTTSPTRPATSSSAWASSAPGATTTSSTRSSRRTITGSRRSSRRSCSATTSRSPRRERGRGNTGRGWRDWEAKTADAPRRDRDDRGAVPRAGRPTRRSASSPQEIQAMIREAGRPSGRRWSTRSPSWPTARSITSTRRLDSPAEGRGQGRRPGPPEAARRVRPREAEAPADPARGRRRRPRGAAGHHPRRRGARPVAPGFLTILDDDAGDDQPIPGVPNSTGRRAALARWLTRPDNPLTHPRDRQPRLAVSLRPRPGGQPQRFRQARRAADPPGAARLARRRGSSARAGG